MGPASSVPHPDEWGQSRVIDFTSSSGTNAFQLAVFPQLRAFSGLPTWMKPPLHAAGSVFGREASRIGFSAGTAAVEPIAPGMETKTGPDPYGRSLPIAPAHGPSLWQESPRFPNLRPHYGSDRLRSDLRRGDAGDPQGYAAGFSIPKDRDVNPRGPVPLMCRMIGDVCPADHTRALHSFRSNPSL